jgi:putative inorganic carbon (hco3(-)) transporter
VRADLLGAVRDRRREYKCNARLPVRATMKNLGLNVYLLFTISWFLHFGARFAFLGAIRFDLLLVCILATLALSQTKDRNFSATQIDKVLVTLIAYAVLTIPFVEWPGSVIKSGIPNLTKAVVFYFFTVAFIKTEPQLKKFVFVFLACQLFRIIEPLYLHITEDYWGSAASMADWESLARLSGAPYDIVNPNGLAFVVCTVLPFLYFLSSGSAVRRLMCFSLMLASIYVLSLTGSRSGMIGLAVILVGIIIKSKRRLLLTVSLLIIAVTGFSLLNADMQDRYLSAIGKGEKNAATSHERMEGMEEQIRVAMRRPIFGYGLGTSPEANYHYTQAGPYAGREMPAHNLYVELAEELGLPGLVIFLFLIKAIVRGFANSRAALRHRSAGSFLSRLIDGMQIWLAMNFVFSFASYGLSSYEWYLFAGLSVVLQRLVPEVATESRAAVHALAVGGK